LLDFSALSTNNKGTTVTFGLAQIFLLQIWDLILAEELILADVFSQLVHGM
jgi:hypothetical protein